MHASGRAGGGGGGRGGAGFAWATSGSSGSAIRADEEANSRTIVLGCVGEGLNDLGGETARPGQGG